MKELTETTILSIKQTKTTKEQTNRTTKMTNRYHKLSQEKKTDQIKSQ